MSRVRVLVVVLSLVFAGGYWVFARQVPPNYSVVNVTDGQGNQYKGISNGTLETNPAADTPVADALPMLAGQSEPDTGHVPAIVLTSPGWLYVTGTKPSVGTRYIAAAATGTDLIVTVESNVERIFCVRATADVMTFRTYGGPLGTPYTLTEGQFLECVLQGTYPNINKIYARGTFNARDLAENPGTMGQMLSEAQQVAHTYNFTN